MIKTVVVYSFLAVFTYVLAVKDSWWFTNDEYCTSNTSEFPFPTPSIDYQFETTFLCSTFRDSLPELVLRSSGGFKVTIERENICGKVKSAIPIGEGTHLLAAIIEKNVKRGDI
jgi:hypothetical protein